MEKIEDIEREMVKLKEEEIEVIERLRELEIMEKELERQINNSKNIKRLREKFLEVRN